MRALLWPLVVRGELPRLAGNSRRPLRFRSNDPNRQDAEIFFLLGGFQRKLWFARALVLLARGLLLATVVIVAGKILSYLGLAVPERTSLAIAGGLVAWAIVVTALQRVTYEDAARVVDRYVRSGERIGTAVELVRRRTHGEVERLQLRDATARLRDLRPREAVPIRLPIDDLKVLAAIAAALALVLAIHTIRTTFFAPVPSTELLAEAPPDALVEEVGPPRAEFELESMTAGEFNPELLGLDSTLSDLRSGLEGLDLSEEEIRQRLEEAQAQMQARAKLAQKQRQALGALADALQDSSATADAASAMRRGEYDSASQMLADMGKQAGQLSTRARRDVAQSLNEAANKVQPNNADLANRMRRAAQAMASGDAAQVEKSLQELAEAVQQAGQQANADASPAGLDDPGLMPGSGQGALPPEDAQLTPFQAPGEGTDLPGEGVGEEDFQFGEGLGGEGDGEELGAGDGQRTATGAAAQQRSNQQGAGGGAGGSSGSNRAAGKSGDPQDGKVLQLRGRPGDGPAGSVDDSERVALVASSDGTIGGTSGKVGGGAGVDPINVHGENNFVPWDKRQIVRDYFSGGRAP